MSAPLLGVRMPWGGGGYALWKGGGGLCHDPKLTFPLQLHCTLLTAVKTTAKAATQCIKEAQTAMSMEMHQSHALNGGAERGRIVMGIPEIPSMAPHHTKNLISLTGGILALCMHCVLHLGHSSQQSSKIAALPKCLQI